MALGMRPEFDSWNKGKVKRKSFPKQQDYPQISNHCFYRREQFLGAKISLHSESFPTACLTVGKYSAVKTSQNIWYEGLHNIFIDFTLQTKREKGICEYLIWYTSSLTPKIRTWVAAGPKTLSNEKVLDILELQRSCTTISFWPLISTTELLRWLISLVLGGLNINHT